MDSNNWTVILTSLLSGGILGVVIKGILDKRYHRFSQAFEFKQARYKAISILMLTAMNPNKYEFRQLKRHRPDIEGLKDLDRELEMEYYNSMLFASQKVTSALKEFINKKDLVNYQKVAHAMRKDTYK